MPNASVSTAPDFGARRAPPRGAAGKTRRKPSRSKRGRMQAVAAMLSSVPRYGAIAAGATIGIGIVVNALLMQHGHRPAPQPATALQAAATPVKAIVPPASAGSSRTAAAAQEQPAGRPAPKAAEPEKPAKAKTHQEAAMAAHDDPIARLIGSAPAATHKAKPAGEKTAAGKVAATKAAGGRGDAEQRRKSEE